MRTFAEANTRRSRWARRVVVNATVRHPVEVVFVHLTDPMRWHEFAPAVAFRRPIGEGPIGIGSRWMSTDRIGPFRIHFVDELAALEPHRRVVWLSSAPWNARVEYACQADASGTRVRATYEGDLGGSLRWQLGWVPSMVFRWILAQDFRRLDRLLTARAREARRWRERHPEPTARVTDLARRFHERSGATGT